jgi:hypothetical protein
LANGNGKTIKNLAKKIIKNLAKKEKEGKPG